MVWKIQEKAGWGQSQGQTQVSRSHSWKCSVVAAQGEPLSSHAELETESFMSSVCACSDKTGRIKLASGKDSGCPTINPRSGSC